MNKLLLTATAVLAVAGRAFADLPKPALSYSGDLSGTSPMSSEILREETADSAQNSRQQGFGGVDLAGAVYDDLWGMFRRVHKGYARSNARFTYGVTIGPDGKVENSSFRMDSGPGDWLKIKVWKKNGFQVANQWLAGMRDIGAYDTVGSSRLSSPQVVEPVVVATPAMKPSNTRLADRIADNLMTNPGAERYAHDIREAATNVQRAADDMSTVMADNAEEQSRRQGVNVIVTPDAAGSRELKSYAKGLSRMAFTASPEEYSQKYGEVVGLASYVVQEAIRNDYGELKVESIVFDKISDSMAKIIPSAQALIDAAGGLVALTNYVIEESINGYNKRVALNPILPKYASELKEFVKSETSSSGLYESINRTRVEEVDSPGSSFERTSRHTVGISEKTNVFDDTSRSPLLENSTSGFSAVSVAKTGIKESTSKTKAIGVELADQDALNIGASEQEGGMMSILEVMGQEEGIKKDLRDVKNEDDDSSNNEDKGPNELEKTLIM
jgi:hypothetical protein